ncbi:MAG: hypothetical protein WCC59_05225 [Terriglobales bacterium]
MSGDSFLGLKVIVNSNLAAGTVMVSEDVWALMKKAAEKMPEECPRCGSTELGSEPDGGGVRCGPCGLVATEWATFPAATRERRANPTRLSDINRAVDRVCECPPGHPCCTH